MASYIGKFVKTVKKYVSSLVCENCCENCSPKRKSEADVQIGGPPPVKKANLEIQIPTAKSSPNISELDLLLSGESDTESISDPIQTEEEIDLEFVKNHEILDASVKPALHDPDFTERLNFLRNIILNPIKFSDHYKSAGILAPKGIYFFGAGINGRALDSIKAIAAELGEQLGRTVRIFRVTQADVYAKCVEGSFVDKVFSAAIKYKPAIIFFQDLDRFGAPHGVKRDETVANIGAQMDALEPGEVFVIATLQDATAPAPFSRLNGPPRFTKFVQFASTVSGCPGILDFLKVQTKEWKISQESENSRDVILPKVSEILSNLPAPVKYDEMTTLCREMYHNAMLEALNAWQGGKEKTTCECCTCPPPPPKLPSLPHWEAGIKANIKPEAKQPTAATPAQPPKVDEFKVEAGLSFAKIGGLAGQIEILKENIINPMRNRGKLKELGWNVEPVRGINFHGPPGTGKTLLGKSLAGELSRIEGGKKFAFFYHKGTECYSKYVGETESKLRAIFASAEAKKPAIIFMDEIDGICSTREEGANKFYSGVVTTMLGLMDNLRRGEIFVIAATNRLSSLDPALRRPGRFDKCVEFQAPKFDGRKSILRIHTAAWDARSKMEGKFEDEIAQRTGGYTGADLEQVCRQAFTFAMKRHSSQNALEEEMPGEIDDFDELIVQKQDWYGALKSVRPNGTNYFGNSVISDKPIPAGAAAALKDKIEDITNRLAYFLKKPEECEGLVMDSKCGGGLNSFLIWGNDAKQLKVINHLFIPALLSSSGFSSVVAAKFEIPPLGGGVEVVQRRISATLAQVLNPGEDKLGVLYVPGIDQLLNGRIGKFSEMKEHDEILDNFEMLRGENNVLLVGTAIGSPDKMSDRVQVLFRGLQNTRHYEFTAPNATEIRLLFSSISSKIPPTAFEKITKKLGGGGNLEFGDSSPRKNLSLYDLLDFEGEISQIFAQFDGLKSDDKENVPNDEICDALEKATNDFCSYLDGQEKYKSALSTMYT